MIPTKHTTTWEWTCDRCGAIGSVTKVTLRDERKCGVYAQPCCPKHPNGWWQIGSELFCVECGDSEEFKDWRRKVKQHSEVVNPLYEALWDEYDRGRKLLPERYPSPPSSFMLPKEVESE